MSDINEFQLAVDPTRNDGRGLPAELPESPMPTLAKWLDHATSERVQPNPNAIVLSTVGADNRPSARLVLCKFLDPDRGTLKFHTNYTSKKAQDIDANPHVALTFHWDTLELQARIEGIATRTPEAESEAYFLTRPWVRKVGAWSSDQSQPIASRDAMMAKVRAAMERFGIDPENPPAHNAKIDIPRPSNWGGYSVTALRVELWVGGLGRVHDRAAWERADAASPWNATRLQP
ncbi:MAG: pyridoxamine 5'-phosphate oxidase [Phycisphaeraceae bacterium]|nr:pyridoxamine 5'-phosphate oxidase [Phycisphaerales bacterium]MCB9858923.1 pyridoxamine 5'-phosphate oxidase [Phycisphaeraceae bacterium]